jgi:hypothetical protein
MVARVLCGNCGVAIPAAPQTCPNCGAVAGAAGGYPGYAPSGVIPPRSYDLGGLAGALDLMLAISAATSLIGVFVKPALIIMWLLLLPITVVFLIWFYRARQNAGQLDWRQRWSPSLAIIGWFVPICFLWFPFQIMLDIWRAALPRPLRAKFPLRPAAWWACWCLAWFTGYRDTVASSGANGSAGTTLTTSHSYSLVFGGTQLSLVFAAMAAFLLRLIVKQVSAGLVGRVGKLSGAVPWQPGATAAGPR